MKNWVDIRDTDGHRLNVPKNTFETYFKPLGYYIIDEKKAENKNTKKNLKKIIEEDNNDIRNDRPVKNPENKDEKQDK